jgi:HEPN domain-containing protein
MIDRLDLRKRAWAKIQSARLLVSRSQWDEATDLCGYAVEIILKASICVAQGWRAFPDTPAEFKAVKHLGIKTHDMELLINLTNNAYRIKANHMKEWSTCIQWSPEARYQPPGTATESSAKELLESAEIIVRAIQEEPGLEAAIVSATANPYVKICAVERELAVEKGGFTFFAMMHREGGFSGSADIVVAAPWIEEDANAAKHVREKIVSSLAKSELTRISAIITLNRQHPMIRALVSSAVGCEGNVETFLHNCKINGVTFDAVMLVTLARR